MPLLIPPLQDAASQLPAAAPIPQTTPQVLTAHMVFDGKQRTIRYGPGEDFESPDDFFAPCVEAWRGPYQAMLDFLWENGWLQDLPVDNQGILRVSLPFCGSVQEIQTLVEFLRDRLLVRPDVKSIYILGSDIDDWNQKGGYWIQKERFVNRKYPRILLKFCQIDLGTTQHPDSAWILGIHPECTFTSSPWRKILANIIHAAKKICLIATFKEGEMEVVRSVCQELKVNFKVHKNPYWIGRDEPTGGVPPYLQYLIMVRCGP